MLATIVMDAYSINERKDVAQALEELVNAGQYQIGLLQEYTVIGISIQKRFCTSD